VNFSFSAKHWHKILIVETYKRLNIAFIFGKIYCSIIGRKAEENRKFVNWIKRKRWNSQ